VVVEQYSRESYDEALKIAVMILEFNKEFEK
jgi:hypothetical protein